MDSGLRRNDGGGRGKGKGDGGGACLTNEILRCVQNDMWGARGRGLV